MRIENLREIKEDGKEKSVATVIFEDIERDPADVYFHTSEEYSQSFKLNPHAFLLAGYLSAMNIGEKRIYIDGKVDEAILKGLLHNMRIFQKWYGRKYKVLPIESSNKVFSQSKNSNLNTGLFFSGGVDSIYSLRNNRLKYKPDHPLYIKDCFIINGFDMNKSNQLKEDQEIFKRAFTCAEKITKEAGADLIPVYTNLRHYFYGDASFWPKWHHGSALAAVGHCFTSRINTVFIASTFGPSMLDPWGSHPLIDPNHGSNDLKIIHDDLFTTFEKLKLISAWEIGFQNIRSCYQNDKDLLNCCHCLKCTRIMIALMALGVLEKSQAFPIHNIPPKQLKEMMQKQSVESLFKTEYLDLVPLLRKHGHENSAKLILQENRLKSKLRRLDQSYFSGNLKKLINSLH